MGADGQPVYLKDIWPSNQEITETIRKTLSPDMYRKRYRNVFSGDDMWRTMGTSAAETPSPNIS